MPVAAGVGTLIFLTVPGLVFALIFFAAIDRMGLWANRRLRLPWRKTEEGGAVSAAGLDEMDALFYATKRYELDQRRTSLMLRDEETDGAPPHSKVDLDGGTALIRPPRRRLARDGRDPRALPRARGAANGAGLCGYGDRRAVARMGVRMEDREEALVVSLKRAASALNEAGVDFALAGGFAAYARGAAISTHDVDFVLLEQDVETALAALTGVGMRRADAPEDWLAKVYDDDRLVDLIFRPSSKPVDGELLGRAGRLKVAAVTMPVLAADDLIIMRLLAYTETGCDFSDYLHVCRALREQVDWARVAEQTAHSPYAYAFLVLLNRLDVIEGVPL